MNKDNNLEIFPVVDEEGNECERESYYFLIRCRTALPRSVRWSV